MRSNKFSILPGLIVVLLLLMQHENCVAQLDEEVAPKKTPLVFVITGESNSGGLGNNSDATAREREPRCGVQIMNLTDGRFQFEQMQLGGNNLRDHFRLDKFYKKSHGFENELANAVENNAFPGYKQVYLIKTGQGGSRIAQWGEQHSSGYWKKFTQRVEAGKKQLPENPVWIVWFSLGINDAIAKTPVTQWKKETIAHIKKIQLKLPGAIIVMTKFDSMGYPKYNIAISEISDELADVFAVDSKGAKLRDKNHWDYKGLKTVTQRMVKVTQKAIENRNKIPK